mmetsp:Transcript_11179/g.28306  ORF Transcript_11179/g.28306 Transcript_11179/m.28306 type:complete len:215 (-) Transcript_11179:109-753(-)
MTSESSREYGVVVVAAAAACLAPRWLMPLPGANAAAAFPIEWLLCCTGDLAVVVALAALVVVMCWRGGGGTSSRVILKGRESRNAAESSALSSAAPHDLGTWRTLFSTNSKFSPEDAEPPQIRGWSLMSTRRATFMSTSDAVTSGGACSSASMIRAEKVVGISLAKQLRNHCGAYSAAVIWQSRSLAAISGGVACSSCDILRWRKRMCGRKSSL